MTTDRAPKARIGIDIGGTFTDFVLEIGGAQHSTKLLTTPDAPEQAVLNGVGLLLAQAGLGVGDVGVIVHGTTLATNALIERRGARTALITTEGFRDVLESGFESRYEQYDLTIENPAPLVPRRLRFTVPERIDSRGRVRLALDEAAVAALIPKLKADGVEAVAVGFLNSYANPAHELRVAEILTAALPEMAISLSSVVSPEMREYERFSTTCANAYVQPKMATYLAALEKGIAAMGIACPLLLILSSGGITTVETARAFPVRLVESGPAGGAIFASYIARQLGQDRVLSFDMGGTTAKICLIDDFTPQTAHDFEVARIYRFRKGSGLPLRIPVIEMVEIGAGGGSIAAVDALRRITVGPESASSKPGPACYGLGGTRPTITDADVVLGRIEPASFAGGKIRLDGTAAGRALDSAVGTPLGLGTEHAAFGVSEMVDENMANAARVHAIESGKTVGDCTLIAFGGAAPLHTARVAEKLGVRSFIIPIGAGVGSAVGFLRAPVAYEIVRSHASPLSGFDIDDANALLAGMCAQASAVVTPAAFGQPVHESRTAFMRYVGQGHQIPVPVENGVLTEASVARMKAAFEAEYSHLYSRVVPGEIEILGWVVRLSTEAGSGETVRDTAGDTYTPEPVGTRAVFDPGRGSVVSARVYDRTVLRPGASFAGPAVVTEIETTTIVSDRFNARVNSLGYLECTLKD